MSLVFQLSANISFLPSYFTCQHLITCNFYKSSLSPRIIIICPGQSQAGCGHLCSGFFTIFAATLHPVTVSCKEELLSAVCTNNPYYGSERLFLAWLSSQQQNREMRGKKEIQRLCCFRIDDDDDGREMLNINIVFKLSNFCLIVMYLCIPHTWMTNERRAMKLLAGQWLG